jgi:hypothetical protein
MAGLDPIGIRISGGSGKNLPLPLREGVGGRGSCRRRTNVFYALTPPPNPLQQGEGENFMPRSGLILMPMGLDPAIRCGTGVA